MPSERDASFSIVTVFIGAGRTRAPLDSRTDKTVREDTAASFRENTKKD